MQHSDGFKARMVERMSGPEAISATALADEVGVSQSTLSRWRREAGSLNGMSKKQTNGKSQRPSRRSAEDKLRIVMAAAALQDADLGEFLRREGIHEVQLDEWRTVVTRSAVEGFTASPRKRRGASPESKRIRDLERELARKEKALAEAAALLVLQKKVAAWSSEGEDASTRQRNDSR